MDTTVERLSGSRVCLTLTFSAENVKRAFDKAYGDLAHQVNIPGFRRGKAPRMILERYVTKEAVGGQVVTDLVPESLSAAIQDEGLQVVGEPQLDFEPPKPDAPFTVKATVLTFPEVTVGSLEGLTVVRPVLHVGDDEIDRAIETIRQSRAVSVAVEGRPVQKGDYASVRYQVTCEGEDLYPADTLPEMYLEVGAEWYDPAVDDHLVGMEKGETKAIDVTYPEDYDHTRLAGKQAVYTATVERITERQVPEVDDALFSDLGVADLDGLRALIRTERSGKLNSMMEDRFTIALRRKLASRCEIDLAPELVDIQGKELRERFEQTLDDEGLTLEAYLRERGITEAAYESDMGAQAERTLRASLAMGAFAKQEGIEVSDEDLEEAVWNLAQSAKMTFSEMSDALRESGELDDMRLRRVTDLAEKRLLELITVVEREMTVEELIAGDWEREGEEEAAEAEGEGEARGDAAADADVTAEDSDSPSPPDEQTDESTTPKEAAPGDAQG